MRVYKPWYDWILCRFPFFKNARYRVKWRKDYIAFSVKTGKEPTEEGFVVYQNLTGSICFVIEAFKEKTGKKPTHEQLMGILRHHSVGPKTDDYLLRDDAKIVLD